MKTLGSLAFVLWLTLGSATSAFAQENPNPQDKPSNATTGQTSDQGTSPQGMGSTGWTGPHRGETASSAPTTPYVPSPSLDKQPPVATGADLRGPPMAFPSNQAPE
jgi:hypothetical protein